MAAAALLEEPALTPMPTFDELFEAHFEYVFRALRYLGVREADLDDVTQDVFLVVHRRLATFEQRSTARTWVYAIALRVASDYRRLARHRLDRAVDRDADADELGRADHGGTVEARSTLLKLLGSLEEGKRAVVVLHEIEGFTIPEVAELLTIPLPTAYTRLRDARIQLERAAKRSEEAP